MVLAAFNISDSVGRDSAVKSTRGLDENVNSIMNEMRTI